MTLERAEFHSENAPPPPLPALLRRWLETARQRAALARLTDHELRDIGLTRAQARREAGRWFWDL